MEERNYRNYLTINLLPENMNSIFISQTPSMYGFKKRLMENKISHVKWLVHFLKLTAMVPRQDT
jgi:hypothetical protein